MNLTRRSFLHASLMAGGLVAVPQFGRWFQPPDRPLIQRPDMVTVTISGFDQHGVWRQYTTECEAVRGVAVLLPTPITWGLIPAGTISITGRSIYALS